jgi:natural product biosynthesis luciferase-like monooxygenase protein
MGIARAGDGYPLTPIQHGMLVQHLKTPASGTDIEQMVVTFSQPPDADGLRAAWEGLISRHDVFRTSFVWEHLEEPRQIVHQDVALPWAEHDWRDLSPEVRSRQFDAFLTQDRARGFDPRVAPLTRVAFLRLADDDTRLVWTFHHMLADGQSYPLLIREAFHLYEARRDGRAVTLEAPGRYRDFIDWLRNHQRTQAAEAEGFWRHAMQGFRAPTPLPFLPAGESNLDTRLREKTVRLSAETSDALTNLAQACQVTVGTLLEGAWALVLSHASGEDDVVFGVTRAGRRSTVPDADRIVGSFINTVPVRVGVDRDQSLADWLRSIRALSRRLREFEHTPLINIQKWSEIPAASPLFHSLLIFTPRLIGALMKEEGSAWQQRDVRFHEQTGFAVTLFAYGERELVLKLAYDPARLSDDTIERWLDQLRTILEAMPADGERRLADLPVLSEAMRHQVLDTWNATSRDYDSASCVHEIVERQVERSPAATAVVFRGQTLSYAELNDRANRVARRLRELGVTPDSVVGISVDRSLEMVVGLLGILKAGGAYLPLDPAYPKQRLAWMIEDTATGVLLTQEHLVEGLPPHTARVVLLDAPEFGNGGRSAGVNHRADVTPDNLAYVIFTSGSSGRPKGVMVRHRNVTNFFAGMDDQLESDAPGTWLAVTSISFDISVLELFWTLTRGFKVVLQDEMEASSPVAEATTAASRGMEFSLFYFAADAGEASGSKYRLLLEGARYADAHGFSAVWTPERHFHAFGGLYPNPAVTSAAIAAVTSRVQIRAGSVVLPLHDPIRVAEEWAVVDNLSQGRVGLSFASGWHVNDFALMPGNYKDRRAIMANGIEIVRRLWRGDTVAVPNGNGEPIDVRIFPAPVQREPQIWLTSAGNIDSFRLAGQLGANLLTNLLGQKPEELAVKIAAYREARRDAGHPGPGHVSLMLHTFIGEDVDQVRTMVRGPFIAYLKTSTELVKQARWEFPAFATPGRQSGPTDNSDLSEAEIDAMMDHAFERYFHTSGLFGTPDTCLPMVRRLERIGVDEIACLLDFGVATDAVLDSLALLNQLRERCTPRPDAAADHSVAAQIQRHEVTHLQCTPSLLRTVLADAAGRDALGRLDRLLVGGEPLPPALAAEILPLLKGKLLNMYGPTETTVWSTVAHIAHGDGPVTIGRPIANTQIYLVNRHTQPVPIGVAGELLIGGAGVTRGYWNRPDLTAEKFVANPFRPNEADRLYRTGDLARYRDDGRIEFLGRLDQQVKVRGHRIELEEVETVLGQHPTVGQAVVAIRPDASGEPCLVAYAVAKTGAGTDGAWNADRWRTVWDETYRERPGAASPADPTFDISGWRSSYTGAPMPDADMHEWVDHTVSRIRGFGPRRILEIGCGSGLLLFRLAGECAAYTAIDFSSATIEKLRREVSAHGLRNAALHVAAADALPSEIGADPFDVVVINSVAQYFPGAEYLVGVIEAAVNATAAGGTVFVGDVRHLALLEAFHTSVELAQAPPSRTRTELKQRIAERMDREPELVIAPAFFERLRAKIPAITNVAVHVKRGRRRTEMACFRYDAILQVNGAGALRPGIEVDATAGQSLDAIRAQLAAGPGAITLRGIVNPRVDRDLRAVALLSSTDCPETAGDLRNCLQAPPEAGIEPEDLFAAAGSYDVELTLAQDGSPGRYDATFRARAQQHPAVAMPPPAEHQPWRDYVHHARAESGGLVPVWKQYLKERLPAYMVPSAFVVLDAVPLTPNGKVDRRALPEPDRGRIETATPYVAPASDVEAVIAETWQGLLNLDRVGAHDNFFDIGANSLLMVQAHTLLRDKLQRPLSLVDLFRFPTVSALAAALHQGTGGTAALADSQLRAQARLKAAELRRQGRLSPVRTERPSVR